MTDSYGYLPIPVVPTATNNPTSFTHARTILEIVDRVRAKLDVLNNELGTYEDNFNSLVSNVNSACQSAISACQTLATGAASVNATTAEQIDTALSQLAAAQLSLSQALTAAQTATASAQQTLTSYQSDVARQDQSIADQFAVVNTTISGYVKQNTIVYNVRDYGAVGDGVTDDSDAVINCINSAKSGGIVFFPEGIYLITKPLTFPTDSVVRGIGIREGTSGKGNPPSNGIFLNVPQSLWQNGAMLTVSPNCLVQDIAIWGPKSGTGIYCSSSCTFDNVDVQLFNTAFSVANLWYGYFRNLRLYQNNTGFECSYCYNMKLLNPRFSLRNWDDEPGIGFNMNLQMDIGVIGGSIESYDTAFKYGSNYAEHVSLIDVYMEANSPVQTFTSQYGAIPIDMTNTSQCSIYLSGCHFYLSNTHAFIRANGANRGVITSIGNKMKGGANSNYLGYYCQSNGSTNVARVMIGDDMTSTSPNPTVYVTPPPDSSSTQSLIVIPLGGKSQ